MCRQNEFFFQNTFRCQHFDSSKFILVHGNLLRARENAEENNTDVTEYFVRKF